MNQVIHSLYWKDDTLYILDQRYLPLLEKTRPLTQYEEVIDAIKTLAVRGAPAIGVAAGYAVVLAAREEIKNTQSFAVLQQRLLKITNIIVKARPTAVNLSWAIHRMNSVIYSSSMEAIYTDLLHEAQAIEKEDQETCLSIAKNGASIFGNKKDLTFITHCNTGALATTGVGTAYGIFHYLAEHHQVYHVYADETRPLLQGSRLTGYELMKDRIPYSIICDNMAADIMKQHHIDAVIVGADRIASNGDTANKVGSYGLAILAQFHKVPFYVAAPFSTFDFSISSGQEIPIEERNPDEVRKIQNIYISSPQSPVCNPAFDVIPHELIHGIITERGILTKPFNESIKLYERRLSDNV